jgi:hypothetical protein
VDEARFQEIVKDPRFPQTHGLPFKGFLIEWKLV